VSDQHPNIAELITAFVDGELSESEAEGFERHMAGDAGTARLVAAERSAKQAVATKITRAVLPPGFRQRIGARVFADEPGARAPAPFWRLLTGSPAFATTAGAVVLVAVLAIVAVVFRGERVLPYVHDVHAHHTQVDRFPVTIVGDYEEVAREATALLGFEVSVPRLGEQYVLRGARKCTLCDQVIAFLKYHGGDEGLISLFIIPNGKPAIWRLEKHSQDEMDFYTAHHRGVHMAFWRDAGVTYCIAAQIPEERLLALARTASQQVHRPNTLLTVPADDRTKPGERLLAAVSHRE
jgi:anti-sigma factor RsiW